MCNRVSKYLIARQKKMRVQLWSAYFFIYYSSFIQLTESFPRPVEHPIEMEASQSQVGADLFLSILGQIEPEEQLDISFVRHLFEDLPDQIGFLSLQ